MLLFFIKQINKILNNLLHLMSFEFNLNIILPNFIIKFKILLKNKYDKSLNIYLII